MPKREKSLQNLTETEAKIRGLLALKQIQPKDLKLLREPEKRRFEKVSTEMFNSLKGTERDEFYKKIEPITTESTKNQLWENNHNQITWAISTLMQEYGRMPTKTEIATETELSRQTVYKHLKEYTMHPLYIQQIEQFRFMTAKVLARVFQYAVTGDVRAAKLYFEVMGNLTGHTSINTLIQNQKNYIQINGTVLCQETIKQLNPEQLNIIEGILKTATVTKTH